ncbi:MAG: hypothetical protein ACLPUO_22640 [Streptosporangiaceae bacterium]
MIRMLRGPGITSDVAYLAAMLSIGASVAAWGASPRMEDPPGEKADRWDLRRIVGADVHGPRQRNQDRRGPLSARR